MAYVDLTAQALRKKALEGPKPFDVIAGGLASGLASGFKTGYEMRRNALKDEATAQKSADELAQKQEAARSPIISALVTSGDVMPDGAVVPGEVLGPNQFAGGGIKFRPSTPAEQAERAKNKRSSNPMNDLNLRGKEKFLNQINSDKQILKINDRLGAADSVDTLLNANMAVADKGAQTQIARLAGEVGVLTDADVTRWGGSQDLMSRANQLFEKNATGKLTESNRDQLRGVVSEFRKVLDNSRKERAAHLADSFSKTYGVGSDTLNDIGGYVPPPGSKAPPVSPPAPNHGPPPGAVTKRTFKDGTVHWLDANGNEI